jgi:hypothetical protein
MALEQPKKPAGGAFGAFMNEKRSDFLKQCPGKPACEAVKLGSSAWRELSDAKKRPYQKAFEEAKAKYEKDMAAFLEAGGVKTKGTAGLRTERRKEKEGKSKKNTDPNRPKKPAGGAFGCYLAENREAFMKQCAGQPITAVTKLASVKWKKASEKDRANYEKLYQEKKAKYEEAMRNYVPPEGAEEDEDEEKDDQVEAEDNEEGVSDEEEEPPKKKAKTTKANSEVDAGLMAKAKKSNMDRQLQTLVNRPEIKAKSVSAEKVFKALQDAKGKTIVAKRALLGA